MSTKRQGLLHSFENPFLVVVLLLTGLFVLGPFLQAVHALEKLRNILTAVTACFALILGIVASKPTRNVLRIGVTLCAVVLVASVLGGDRADIGWNGIARLGFAMVSMIALVTILRFVLEARSVRGEEIFAAIAAYLLLGFFWAYLYIALEGSQLDAPAFRGLDTAAGADEWPQLTYYSFVTLTTLGYGDIVPANDYARSLATFEAITGQLFIAVLLARLVALQTMNSVGSKEP